MLDTTINCPHCKKNIEIDKVFKNQWSSQVNAAYQKKYNTKEAELAEREEAIKTTKSQIQNQIDVAVAEKIKMETSDIKKAEKKSAEDLVRDQLEQAAQDKIELNNLKTAKLLSDQEKATQESEVELKIERAKAAQAAEMQANFDRKREEDRVANEVKFNRKREEDRVANEVKIEQIKKSVGNVSRQVNQGSMQIQGEALEVCVQNFLTQTFPLDSIEPIKQGVKGADCLQQVSEDGRNFLGTIYLEMKKTQDFKKPWINKFKSDIREKNADYGVLITETMPKGATKPQMMDGIWVCSVDDYEMVIHFIRHHMVELNRVKVVNENVIDKQALVYKFLTSKEFARMMDLFFDLYKAERKQLEDEKKWMNNSWGKRGKNLDSMKEITASLIGSFQSYLGDSISEIK